MATTTDPRDRSRLPTVGELRERYLERGRPLPRSLQAELRADPRAGVAAVLEAIESRHRSRRRESQRVARLCRFERELQAQGFARVAGIDEAGMSPLAGPVVAGAVVLPLGYRRVGIDDSKKLSAEQREELAVHIKREALAWAIGVVEPEEIDRINIYRAGLLAMRRAIEALCEQPDYLLIDARSLKELPIPQRGIVRGDSQSISIAAASIVAKTSRDARMVELDQRFPGYGFARHKGYPVHEHVRAIAALGVCDQHRRSFAPVRAALGGDPVQVDLFATEAVD
jgi:ribonuclease HII